MCLVWRWGIEIAKIGMLHRKQDLSFGFNAVMLQPCTWPARYLSAGWRFHVSMTESDNVNSSALASRSCENVYQHRVDSCQSWRITCTIRNDFLDLAHRTIVVRSTIHTKKTRNASLYDWKSLGLCKAWKHRQYSSSFQTLISFEHSASSIGKNHELVHRWLWFEPG